MPRVLRRLTRRRAQQGAAAVEFALVFPLLIMLIFGLVTTALAYFDHSSASNAVREAARYGAATDASSSWATSVRDRLKQTYFDSVNGLTDAQMNDHICVQLIKSDLATVVAQWTGSQCGSAPTPLPTMTSGTCAVVVWMRKPEKIDLVVFPSMNFNIGAESVAYYGRTLSGATPACKAS